MNPNFSDPTPVSPGCDPVFCLEPVGGDHADSCESAEDRLRYAKLDLYFYVAGLTAGGLPTKAGQSILDLADAIAKRALEVER